MTETPVVLENIVKCIREFEADHGTKPCTISVNDEEIKISFDKTVLYHIEPIPQTRWRRFINWLNQRDISFDKQKHQGTIKQNLKVVNQVTVERKNKLFPIPYFDISIPFWKQVGTQVKDNKNLAIQNIKVSLIFKKDNVDDAEQIIDAIKTAATLSEGNGLPSAAKRASWNPIKNSLHWLSDRLPRSWINTIKKILPNWLIKTSRPNDWGTGFSDCTLDTPFINSGVLASLVSGGLLLTLFTAGIILFLVLAIAIICAFASTGSNIGSARCIGSGLSDIFCCVPHGTNTEDDSDRPLIGRAVKESGNSSCFLAPTAKIFKNPPNKDLLTRQREHEVQSSQEVCRGDRRMRSGH